MDALKEARKTLHLTQDEFAKLLGISRNYLAQMETGRCKVPQKIFDQINIIVSQNQLATLEHWRQRALIAEAKLDSLKAAMIQVIGRF